MAKRLWFDSETCGLYGLAVILQYKEAGGEIVIHEVWKRPIRETLELIEWMLEHEVVGFNLTFDWFHICKLYTVLSQFPGHLIPETIIDDIGEAERAGQEGPCIKPYSALDLLLYSRKGPYQSLMAREDIRIRRVPTQAVECLKTHLEQNVQIDGIYFARKAKGAPRWLDYPVWNDDRTAMRDDVRDIVLKFHPAGGLKFLAEHCLGITDVINFDEIGPLEKSMPKELGYAPFCTAISRREDNWAVFDSEGIFKGRTWPGVIRQHIEHWHSHELARQYARKDVEYTEGLDWFWAEKKVDDDYDRAVTHYKLLCDEAHAEGVTPPVPPTKQVWDGKPLPAGDDDSILACMVGAVRWKGFEIDCDGLQELHNSAAQRAEGKPLTPAEARAYLKPVMSVPEYLQIRDSTSRVKLEAVAKTACICRDLPDGMVSMEGNPDCDLCHGKGLTDSAHRAAEVLEARKAVKECELYAKLITARKFHASLNVIGTLSSRMSGADGLNPQGIKREAWVRGRFPFAKHPYVLCGGDFSSFEVTLADAAYHDPQLNADLRSGRKIHADMAAFLFGYTYEQVVAGVKAEGAAALAEEAAAKAEGRDMRPVESKFTSMYNAGKQAVFALIYGGDFGTISRKLGVLDRVAREAYFSFLAKYPKIAERRAQIQRMFCSMQQPGGLGKEIFWNDPHDYMESILGFRRYFTLENAICKALYNLAQSMPEEITKKQGKVQRRKWMQAPVAAGKNTIAIPGTEGKFQGIGGATQSAVYGAAFQIQAAAMRAASNHEIQSSGAEITKAVERAIWDVQPWGIQDWRVAPLNVHDEILSVTHPDYVDEVADIVKAKVEYYRPKVPLIGMSWGKNLTSWADTH